MKTQHTPGPWARNISPAWKYPIYDEKNHNKIAYIIKDAGISETEQEANLNLIVAAPELLEALDDLLEWADSQCGRSGNDECYGCYNDGELCSARAAILKARGREL